MDTPLINLHPEQEDQQASLSLNLHEGLNTPTLPDGVIKNRGVKYHMALGQSSPGVEALINSVSQGTEDLVRENAVRNAQLEDREVKASIIDQYMRERPQDVAPVPGEFEFLQSLSTSELMDKSDVLEKKYAEWVVNTSFAEDRSGQATAGIDNDPENMDASTKAAVGIISTTQLAQRLFEEAKAATGFVDSALTFLPFYENIQSREFNPEDSESSFAWLQGSSRQSQLQDFWMRPEAERTRILLDAERAWKEGGENAALARDYFASVMQYSEFAKNMANVGSATDALELVPGGVVFDALKGTVKAGSKLGKRIAKVKPTAPTKATEVGEPPIDGVTPSAPSAPVPERMVPLDDEIRSSYESQVKSLESLITEGKAKGEDVTFYEQDLKIRQDALKNGNVPESVFADDVAHLENIASITKSRKDKDQAIEFKYKLEQIRANDPELNLDEIQDVIANGDEKVIAREVVDPDSGKVTTQVLPDTPVNRSQGVLDAAIENGRKSEFDPVDINVTNGNLEDATIELVLQDARIPVEGTSLGYSKKLSNNLASFFNPGRYTRRASRWSLAAKEQLEDTLYGSRNSLLQAVRAGIQARSVTREQLENALPDIKAEALKRYHSVNNAVLDAEWELIDETQDVAGRTLINVPLGRPDGTLFESAEAALDAAVNLYNLKPGSFAPPVMKGSGWFLKVSQPVDMTSDKFRDILIDTANTSPESMAGAYTQYLLGGNVFMSEAGRANRRVAAHQQSRVYALIMEAAEAIPKPGKKDIKLLDAFLEKQRDREFDVVTDGPSGAIQDRYKRGYWYKSVDQFEMAWKDDNGVYPSEEVTTAYFQFKQLSDFQYLVLNTKTVRDKSRMGISNFSLNTIIDDNGSLRVQSVDKTVEARLVDDIQPEKRVHIIDTDNLEQKYINTKTDGVGIVNEYKDKGYRILQLANPGQFPLKNIVGHDNYVNYVMVKDFESSQLDMMQIPYQEGGHIIVDVNHKVVQTQIRTTSNGEKVHTGDRLFMVASSENEAKLWYSRMEEARKLLVAGSLEALDSYLRSGKLPMRTLESFQYYFEVRKPKFPGDTDLEPIFDKNIPFAYMADRVGSNDAAKTHLKSELAGVFDGVVDNVDDTTNLYRDIDKEFTGQKSPMAYTITGEEGQWNFTKARHINPMETMQRSLATMSRNIVLDQLQRQTVENWIQENTANGVLNIPQGTARQDPFEHFMNPEYSRNAKPEFVGAAKAQRLAGMQFLGLRDPTNRMVDMARNRILNSVFDKKGKGAVEWVDDHMLPLVQDPTTYMRAASFHMTMGLLNPVQVFVNGVALAHTTAITGNLARSGTSLAGASMVSMGRMTNNPKVIAGYAKKAAKFGWKEVEFKEFWKLTRDQGIGIVGGEVGYLDNAFGNQKLFQGKIGQFLEKSTLFFKETERMIRLNAFAVAYREFRSANPNKVINPTELGKIMDRYGNLSLNMTNENNAFWQQGVLSIPLQFSSFHARMVEQLMGNQLTRGEKARVLATYSALYGLPVGLSLGLASNPITAPLSVYPWADDIRQAALERGIKINDGVFGVLMNGLISAGLETVTGTQFNVAARLGPNGLPLVKDVLEGDKTALQLAFGPPGTIISDTLTRAMPALKDIVTFDIESLKQGDFIGAFQGISTVSNVTKLLYALQSGKFLTKNGTIVGDMNSMEAWVMATVGLTPQEFADSYIKIQSMKELAAAEQQLNKEFKKYITRAYRLPPGSPERLAMVTKAFTFLAERPDPRGTAARLIYEVKGGDTQVETVNKKFLKKGPASQLDDRADAFRNDLQNEQE